jgi:hypothetical protein
MTAPETPALDEALAPCPWCGERGAIWHLKPSER